MAEPVTTNQADELPGGVKLTLQTSIIPILTAGDVYQFCKNGHMADHTWPKWFHGTVEEFIKTYAKQNFDNGMRHASEIIR